MNRHFWRACDREAGFSFVELLVTILIAGIAFAAMVPVFVSAQQVSSGEQMRNVSLQLAQDKLEKVRGLDYDLITQANLQSSTFADSQFGTSVSWATGGGGSRTFTVTYQVDLIDSDGNAGATPGDEAYKQVTITTAWTGRAEPRQAGAAQHDGLPAVRRPDDHAVRRVAALHGSEHPGPERSVAVPWCSTRTSSRTTS